jgi:hypothetical protein
VDVDEPRAEPGRAVDVMLQDLDRSLEEVGLAASQVHQIGGVDGDGTDVELAKFLAKRGLLLRRLGPATPRGRVVAEDWSAVAPIAWARSTALTIPPPRAGGHRAGVRRGASAPS